mmetsp:Transcript_86434/g.241854  ORF Transcript_86434/g.241854 Transcript_86434/m.241854 type:complete len:312 (-) Transcript_86434:114-1049(-)
MPCAKAGGAMAYVRCYAEIRNGSALPLLHHSPWAEAKVAAAGAQRHRPRPTKNTKGRVRSHRPSATNPAGKQAAWAVGAAVPMGSPPAGNLAAVFGMAAAAGTPAVCCCCVCCVRLPAAPQTPAVPLPSPPSCGNVSAKDLGGLAAPPNNASRPRYAPSGPQRRLSSSHLYTAWGRRCIRPCLQIPLGAAAKLRGVASRVLFASRNHSRARDAPQTRRVYDPQNADAERSGAAAHEGDRRFLFVSSWPRAAPPAPSRAVSCEAAQTDLTRLRTIPGKCKVLLHLPSPLVPLTVSSTWSQRWRQPQGPPMMY